MSLKNTIIFGDSYSTFEGHIPEGYASYYYNIPQRDTDVTAVEQTWWHQVITETDSNLIMNNSWSGSTICYTGYEGRDCSGDSSFIFRFNKLLADGFFKQNKIDTVLLFGATNDSWCGAEFGELNFGEVTREDLYKALPAICHFFRLLKENLPDTRIITIINTQLKDEITNGLIEVSKHFNIEYVVLENIDKTSGHPTILGMKQIKDQILKAL